jgi:hypothetical protein
LKPLSNAVHLQLSPFCLRFPTRRDRLERGFRQLPTTCRAVPSDRQKKGQPLFASGNMYPKRHPFSDGFNLPEAKRFPKVSQLSHYI